MRMISRCPYLGCGRIHHKPEHVPRTRKELLHFLWIQGLTNINIFRCGPQYVISYGRWQRAVQGGGGPASKCRNITLLNNGQWLGEFQRLIREHPA